MTKTKKCNWCNKRRLTKDMYRLGVLEGRKKLVQTEDYLKLVPDDTDYWICDKCNTREDVI